MSIIYTVLALLGLLRFFKLDGRSFPNANYSHLFLCGIRLNACDLRGAFFHNADLRDVDLEGASFRLADLGRAFLERPAGAKINLAGALNGQEDVPVPKRQENCG